jgi:hypothetical protein
VTINYLSHIAMAASLAEAHEVGLSLSHLLRPGELRMPASKGSSAGQETYDTQARVGRMDLWDRGRHARI